MADTAAKTNSSEKTDSTSTNDAKLRHQQLGVWSVWTLREKPASQVMNRVQQHLKLFKIAVRIFRDVHRFAPSVFFTLLGVWFLQAMQSAVLIHFESDMLRGIEKGVIKQQPIVNTILWSVASRALYHVLTNQLGHFGTRIRQTLARRFTLHFEVELLDATLQIETASSDTSTMTHAQGAEPEAAWSAFEMTRMQLFRLVTGISEAVVIFREIRSSKLALFLLLIRPFIDDLFAPVFTSQAYIMAITNIDQLRIKTVKKFVRSTYRDEVASNGLKGWILEEYRNAVKRVEKLTLVDPFAMPTSATSAGVSSFLDDMPLVVCLLSTISSDTPFSVANAAIIQSSISTLRASIGSLIGYHIFIIDSLKRAEKLYDVLDARKQVLDGTLSYPEDEEKARDGMSFEVRDLSYSYPGSEDTTFALKNVNFNIPAGSLVVIVGANGSGKSTLIRLLSGYCKPTKGQVKIDGHASDQYKSSDLRAATILLHQDAKVYPVSMGENIGLGNVAMRHDKAMIVDSAVKGGADAFISKLKLGYDTILLPDWEVYSMNGVPYDEKEHPLNVKLRELQAEIDISGGERQRLIASRAFMRMNTDKVKFVAVDEPSSALDAEGELHVFNELIKAREGKTLVFVTHRFGHLTKHADMILTLKEGELVEMGSHSDLMARDGEYAKLYNIQASAFT